MGEKASRLRNSKRHLFLDESNLKHLERQLERHARPLWTGDGARKCWTGSLRERQAACRGSGFRVCTLHRHQECRGQSRWAHAVHLLTRSHCARAAITACVRLCGTVNLCTNWDCSIFLTKCLRQLVRNVAPTCAPSPWSTRRSTCWSNARHFGNMHMRVAMP